MPEGDDDGSSAQAKRKDNDEESGVDNEKYRGGGGSRQRLPESDMSTNGEGFYAGNCDTKGEVLLLIRVC